ncbi:MAG: VWA domain-containing protein [Anaerolineaceae bacterium]|nr:VWA domain-containing protein [Anaerolineaceae bacterium]
MDVLWPELLLFLGLVPLVLGLYIWVLHRKRRYTVRFSSLSLVRAALPHTSRVRRHLPFALFLLALASLVVALSRPVAILTVPTDQTTIILSLDVSGSMRSNDIPPSRLEAAESAALSFIQRQRSTTQIGIVAFAGFGELVQPPTTDQEALQSAIRSLTTGRRTAIGSGILRSIDAIAEVDKQVAPSVSDPTDPNQPTPVPRGAYAPDIIVLLTDGVSNAGPLPLDAAQQAADRGVRIYTIGYGTDHGSIPYSDPFGNNGQTFRGGGPFPGGFRTGIDEETLKQVAALTGGRYYSATSAHELDNVFQTLPTYLITKHQTMEISVAFTAIAALLTVLAMGLSLIWHPLP